MKSTGPATGTEMKTSFQFWVSDLEGGVWPDATMALRAIKSVQISKVVELRFIATSLHISRVQLMYGPLER